MKRQSRWYKWQRGQAFMEYWPTIPAAIIIMLAASSLVQFINGSILQTVDYLNPTGLECPEQEEQEEGPTEAVLDCHTIELVGRSYDEENDRTTVAYKVTSGCDPAISHWMLGAPAWLADKIVSASEKWEYVTDPTTGLTGIKFDTEYGTSKKEKSSLLDGIMFASATYELPTTLLQAETNEDSRTVLLTLGGHFDWGITEVRIKAGTETHSSTITAPIEIYQGTEEECEM